VFLVLDAEIHKQARGKKYNGVKIHVDSMPVYVRGSRYFVEYAPKEERWQKTLEIMFRQPHGLLLVD